VVETATGPIAEHILMAISAGSVFMGANSYIGNAPNFMVKTICEEAKVQMPSFFGYMVYSCSILVPTFLMITYIYLW
jgi:Na+/H+ antiporter NhaD/arsenite permease-like protein